MTDVVSLNGWIQINISFVDDNFIDIETGEICEIIEDFKYHRQAVVYNGQIIEGVAVEEQPDAISIKVEV